MKKKINKTRTDGAFASHTAVIRHPLLSDRECAEIQKAVLAAKNDASVKEQIEQIARFAEAVMLSTGLARIDAIEMTYIPESKEWHFKLRSNKAEH